MNRIRHFFASMTGRIFGILALGMAAAALIAMAVTTVRSDRDFHGQLIERTADRLEAFVLFLDAASPSDRAALLARGGPGLRVQPSTVRTLGIDKEFQEVLAARGTLQKGVVAEATPLQTCFPDLPDISPGDVQKMWEHPEVQRMLKRMGARGDRLRRPSARMLPPTCRLITTALSDGTPLHISVETMWIERKRNTLLDPTFMTLLMLAIAVLAYLVARIASAPLNHMSKAAADLGQDLDRPPMPLSGPTEVRRAAEAFNAMQRRVQQHIGERTNMLAAITHDLQTPLTRLRLRLERVEDELLRERLIGDMNAMKALIDEGLELARSAETSEPRVMLDLDSLLESLVEDAADAGGKARFEGGCRAVLPLRPLAARRLFSNLIENALKYGGSAAVSSTQLGDEIIVRVRDQGPGLPDDMLERVFDPFVRVENSRSRETGGAGLGLTIARTLAQKNGATLTLNNRPEGGLEALVKWRRETP